MTRRHDPTDTAAQEQQRTEKSEARKREKTQEAEDFKWLMKDKRGRRFVWGQLERTGVYRSSFTGNSETFFREGERNIGLMLMAMIHEHSPEAYHLMLKERGTNDN